jgi:hypothetical protein
MLKFLFEEGAHCSDLSGWRNQSHLESPGLIGRI